MALVVVHPFGPYKKGDKITDSGEVERILASSNAPKVVKIGA
jgi:hypothetical protein